MGGSFCVWMGGSFRPKPGTSS